MRAHQIFAWFPCLKHARTHGAFYFDFPAAEWVRFVNLPLIRGATSCQLERLLAWRPRINCLVML
jgi:hypothetical protein